MKFQKHVRRVCATSLVVAMMVAVVVGPMLPVPAGASTPPMVKQVDGGGGYSLALKADGTVWGWGSNFSGQLGDGTTSTTAVPVRVAGLAGAIAIAAGDSHALALRADGTVWAWGDNFSGQLGNGTRTSSSVPVQVTGLSNITGVAAGQHHSLAVRSDGRAFAWGNNVWGQLGDGTSTSRSTTPVQVSGLTTVVDIAAGADHSLALLSNWTVRAWGYNLDGQLGDGTRTLRRTPVTVSGLTNVRSIAGGSSHSLAALFDGSVRSWGANWLGQLGSGGTGEGRVTPGVVIGATGVLEVVAGGNHSFGLGWSGALAWGHNFFGQLGDGTKTTRTTAVLLTTLNPAALGAGRSHSVAQVGEQWAFAWGNNSAGQAGHAPTREDQPLPRVVFGLTGFTSVSAGDAHSVARRFDGTVWASGDNVDGQLGNGTTVPSRTLVQAVGLTDVREVSAGGLHTLALRSDGTVRAWGHNGLVTVRPPTAALPPRYRASARSRPSPRAVSTRLRCEPTAPSGHGATTSRGSSVTARRPYARTPCRFGV